MKFKHSPERDEVVFKLAQDYDEGSLVLELLSIAKKWRSKAHMRQARVYELEQRLEQQKVD